MKPTDTRLTAILYRSFCPESHELGEYHFKLCPPDREVFIHDHLQECPHCRLELQQLMRFLQDVSPDLEFSTIERLKIWVAEKLPERLDISQPLAFGLRGASEKQIFYQAGKAQITVEVQDDPAIPGNKRLLGMVLGIDPAGLQVYCFLAGKQIRDLPVDELGNFVLGGLDPGKYDLLLQNDELEIYISALSIQK